MADRRRYPPQVPAGWRAVWNELHQRYFFVNELDSTRRPTWTNPILIEQRSAREQTRRGPSTGQHEKSPRPAFPGAPSPRIEELPSSNASEDEDDPLSSRVSPSSLSIAGTSLNPDAFKLSPESYPAKANSSSSYLAVDGHEEYGLPPRRQRTDHSSESIKENLSPPLVSPRHEKLSVHDTVREARAPGIKPDLSGPSSSTSHQSERSGPDHEERSSMHGSVASTYDWRSEPPLKQQPGSMYDAYESQPLRPEDDYMMSGALGPASPVRSPVLYAEERGRSRLSPHEEGIETQFPSLERVLANNLPPEGQPGIDKEENAHRSIAKPEKAVDETRKSRGSSLSKTMDRLVDTWQNLRFGDQDRGKYPMNRHRSMKYTKKAQARSAALQDTKAKSKNVSTEQAGLQPFPPFQAEPLRYEPHQSEPLQSEPRTARAKPRIAQSHSPPPTRFRGRRTRISQSHSPPPLRAAFQHTAADQSQSRTPSPRAQRTTRSEEHQDPGIQPPWMPEINDFAGSEGGRYYWLDPEFIAEREEEEKYRKMEAEAAMNHWKTNFRAKPYQNTPLPVNVSQSLPGSYGSGVWGNYR
ncbi:hypothetical protein E2P81_ATG07441 [Venturia nashicola]|uniref:WW domain-containing protein n=1 Tax=Venturia nashicola TaxID=86259 RepID=A0A4Z1P6Y8_9PEZI|nr:hypothetical protein E6O75_ATG07595 [Venturia nashicola]TLD31951.1 hypothetical protein E2P81_ATG07441 [Venturia nashicola]